MIQLLHVSAGYHDDAVLHDIDLTVPDGKVTVLVGPNGCGKSTLLKTLVGMLPLSQGEIRIDGEGASAMSGRERAQKIAYLAQSRQIPDITALRLVLHGRFPYLAYPRRYRPADMAAARNAMAQMGIEEVADCPLADLSGGTRQKVYIAMALCQDTGNILLDEPTTYLDASHQIHLMEQARTWAEQGRAVLLVLHDLPMAMQFADQLALLDHGRLIACGTPEDIYRGGYLSGSLGIDLQRAETPHGPRYYYIKAGERL